MAAATQIDLGTVIYLKDWLTLAALLIGPGVAAWWTLHHQDRAAKRAERYRLFKTLMAHRKANPPSADWATALNLIDVVFADHREVVAKYHELYVILETKPWNQTRYNHGFLELMSEMARALGYTSLTQTDIDKYYAPQAHGTIATRQEELQKELLRVLKASKNFGEPNNQPPEENDELPF